MLGVFTSCSARACSTGFFIGSAPNCPKVKRCIALGRNLCEMLGGGKVDNYAVSAR
jgi:hypothetical protein